MKKFLSVPVYTGSTLTRTDQVGLDGVVSCTLTAGKVFLQYGNGSSIALTSANPFRAGDTNAVQEAITDAMQSNWRKVLFDLPSLPTGNVTGVTFTF